MKRIWTVCATAVVLGAVVGGALLSGVGAVYAAASRPNAQLPFWVDSGVVIQAHRVHVTIDNQVATTRVEQVFANHSDRMAEGTYLFPLPRGAAVSELVMWVDGERIEARILEADEARDIYDEIVRQLRDPALLEYVGTNAIQANVFPIQPGDTVKIEIEYGQLLPVEDNLVHYVYPLRTDHLTHQPVEQLSVDVHVHSKDPISTIYSPSHPVAISREDDYNFRVGYEDSYVRPEDDFSLYYNLAGDAISVNLLSYRESAREDGFFSLLITPPVGENASHVIPKDVIIVLDQSGSMFGDKWKQAREAAQFVLDNLNREDRFNVIAFSTGWRVYADRLQPPSEAQDAAAWLDSLDALGGTDIDGALGTALEMAERERPTVILFLTDGLPTEGETDTGAIVRHITEDAPPNVRLFAFGVGYDVDTFLLDQLAQELRGTSAYVRPEERIDDEVSALYSKISAPVLTDLELEIDGVHVDDMYPAAPLPDLFVGSQLIVVGRYRDGGTATVRLSGKLENSRQTYTYEVRFRDNAGGEPFIPRLWATRKIGALMNAIRLHGEDPELVDSIVRLSMRYGIITPYTSFLITEDDIAPMPLGAAEEGAAFETQFHAPASGQAAVDAAEMSANLAEAEAPMAAPTAMRIEADEAGANSADVGAQRVRYVADRTFVWRDGVWTDTTYDAESMTPVQVTFLSDAYFALLDLDPLVGEFLALGEQVIFVWESTAYEIMSE